MKKLSKFYYVELFVFCMDYHGGQWSRGYRLLSKLNVRNLGDGAIRECRESEAYQWLEQNYSNKI